MRTIFPDDSFNYEIRNMVTNEILSLASIIWDYHHMNHTLEPCDCMLVLGSHDLRVADRAAELYLQGYAPMIVFSGGLGNLTREIWTATEADQFAEIAIGKGVPRSAILIENKSTNTGENIVFSQRLLQQHQLDPASFLVVQKPYMERRSYATFKNHLPHKKILVTSPQISFEEYPTTGIPMEKVINIMVGDLQRIRVYPEKGFQIYQEIPDEVWRAGEMLMEMGFTECLVKP